MKAKHSDCKCGGGNVKKGHDTIAMKTGNHMLQLRVSRTAETKTKVATAAAKGV